MDIKFTDAQNTNFFIVSNGVQNVFTRAGSFYVDAAGNLAMTTTGYLVQGWGVDQETQTIRQDTVQPLRVMSAENKTSQPEATTKASASGILDKNTAVLTGENGYVMSLQFYDSLGYAYTANTDEGEFYVSLTGITDQAGNDILQGANNQAGVTITDATISTLFGQNRTRESSYTLDASKFTSATVGLNSSTISTVANNSTGTSETFTSDGTITQQNGVYGCTFTGATSGKTKFFALSEMYGITDAVAANAVSRTINGGGQLVLEKNSTDFTVKFNPADGSFSYVNEAGSNSVTLNMSALGVNFQNVDIDFSQIKVADNGAASTVGLLRGDTSGKLGAGKKLGNMTGLSVDQSGKIFGSYDNGNTVLLGQIAVAHFANPSGLESLGNNCYGQTLNSGEFDGVGVDVSGDGGKMSTGQLEMSNVDLAREFTNMITTQRGFQANSRIITVSDTLLEELVNLKR